MGLIELERELYNLYKLGETYALFERPEFRDTFALMAEEELRHERTLRGLELPEVEVPHARNPDTLEGLILEAVVLEKEAYLAYSRLSELFEGSLRDILRSFAAEELAHAYRLKLLYGSL